MEDALYSFTKCVNVEEGGDLDINI